MSGCYKDLNPEALAGYFFGEGGGNGSGGNGGGEQPVELDYVDLGLSVKWATCDLGATKPWFAGKFFAWGEISEKNSYSWDTYKFSSGNQYKMTKYCDTSKYGNVDNKINLDTSDDAARAILGSSWRLPTRAEVNELLNNTEWSTEYKNDIKIVVAKSTINGAELTFPISGYKENNSNGDVGVAGYYWVSQIEPGLACDAYYLFLDIKGNKVTMDHAYRYYGLNIRPVKVN